MIEILTTWFLNDRKGNSIFQGELLSLNHPSSLDYRPNHSWLLILLNNVPICDGIEAVLVTCG